MKKFLIVVSTLGFFAAGAVILPAISSAIPCWHGIADKCKPRPCEDQPRCPGIEEK
ncbi:MAG: hypothetical protein KDJ29_02270 [Hyphomicrobiales bacterium]|nr:hypothetical protein [Hyphomicrobiales bacterium]